MTGSGIGTSVGLLIRPDVPDRPNCPSKLLPHASNFPSLVKASECCVPAAICRIFFPLEPQSYTKTGVLELSPEPTFARPS